MFKFKTILPVVIGLLLVVGSVVLAAVPAGTPPACADDTNPGCHPPINVSSTLQLKTGILSLGSLLRLAAGSTRGVDFNSAASGRSTPEGFISYGTANLNIYGGGSATAQDRKVTIFDKICDSLGTCDTVTNIVTNHLANFNCPSGQFVTGFSATSVPLCGSASGGSNPGGSYTAVFNSSAGGNAGACTFTNLPSLPTLDKVPCSTSDIISGPIACTKVNTGSVLWPIYKYYLSCPSGTNVYMAWSTPDRTFVNKLDGMTNKCYQELEVTTITANYTCK